MRGYDTRTGVFSILEKQRYHHSNLYEGAPMPWMQRLTRSGTALHAGVVPGYPASHGCVRLPFGFAPKLFQMTAVGENVVVASNRPMPKLIEHPALFQPPSTAKQPVALADLGGTAPAALFRSWEDENSGPPLRILVTRRTERDQIIDVQYLLSSLGYLPRQDFTGRLGTATAEAIKAFQKANEMTETGLFTDMLVRKVYAVAGKPEPPPGQLFVRQDFKRLFAVPVALRNPEQDLGTHIFTAMASRPNAAKLQWVAITVDGGDAASVLDRIEIPDDVRRQISQRLTPGSSLIVADTSENAAILPDGDDFLVWAKVTPASADKAEGKQHKAAPVEKADMRRRTPRQTATRAQRTEPDWRRAPRRRMFFFW
jgi:lipoprotein-anchoring transpeptidase ErfK/SrfK